MTATILAEAADGRLTLTLNRPDKLNALDSTTMAALARALQTVAHEIRLVVIAGAGRRAFCVGADIAEFRQGPAALEEQGRALEALANALHACPVPTVAVVQGHTLGAGAIVASLCDLVVASDDLAFGAPEMKFGMYPAMVHAALVERVTPAVAWQLCASGRILGAEEAQRLGLVTDVVPAGAAEAVAERLDFYDRNAASLALGRRARRLCADGDLPQRIAAAAALMHENFALGGVRARTAAFAGALGSAAADTRESP